MSREKRIVKEGSTARGEDLERLVATTRKRLRAGWLLTGMGVLLTAVLGWLLLVCAVDLVTPLPVSGRVAGFITGCLILGVTVLVGVLWPGLRPLRLQGVARRIERTIPEIHNRLITVLDLREGKGLSERAGDQQPDAFVERLLEQTRNRLRGYRIEQVTNPRPRRRQLLCAATILTVVVFSVVVGSPRTSTALLRVMRPTADIPPLAWVRLAVAGDLQILQGEPAVIRADVERGRVDSLTLHLRAESGPWYQHPMVPSDDDFIFRISRVDTSYEYKVVGGGTWTLPYRIQAVERPVVESITATVLLPPYTGLQEPRPVDPEATEVRTRAESHVRVEATVEGEVARGEIQLHELVLHEEEKIIENESVWFDDELPEFAEMSGPWRWTTVRAWSGVRSHTFDWQHQTYGFKVPRDRFHVPAGASLFVYVWLDPDEKPRHVNVTFHVGKESHQMSWSELPEAGRWARLEVPVRKLTARKGVRLAGVTFDRHSGRVWFDRVGYLTREKRTVKVTRKEPTRRIAMSREERTGQWVGLFGVRAVYWSATFYNAMGFPSLPMEPMRVVPVEDQPPTVWVERPGETVTLDRLEPVPLVIRAFDDYGVQAVGIKAGLLSQNLDEIRWIEEYREMGTSRRILTTIDPRAYRLSPGAAVHYRIFVRDCVGNEAISELYRVELAARKRNEATPGRDVERRSQELSEGLAQSPLEGWLETLKKILQGEVKTVEKISELLGTLAREMKDVAQEAETSPTALPVEGETLRLVAEASERIAGDLLKSAKLVKEASEGSMETGKLTPEHQRELSMLRQQLEQLRATREAMSHDDDDFQSRVESLMAQAQLQQAMQDLERLDSDLLSERQQLEEIREEQERLRRLTKESEAGSLDEVSREQTALDPKALAALKEARDLLGEELKKKSPLPPAPWEVPGDRQEALRSQKDTSEEGVAEKPGEKEPGEKEPGEKEPGEKEPGEKEPGEKEPGEKEPGEKESGEKESGEKESGELSREGESRWDRPVETPARSVGSEPDQRLDGQSRPTLRDLLLEHQKSMLDALKQTGRVLTAGQDKIDPMVRRMQSMMTEMSREASAPGKKSSDRTSSENMKPLAQLLASSELQSLLEQARRARGTPTTTSRQSRQPGRGGGAPGRKLFDGALGPGGVEGRRGALYRLPPEMRQSLLEAMEERGPSAYQPLIDAYFRKLTEEGEGR